MCPDGLILDPSPSGAVPTLGQLLALSQALGLSLGLGAVEVRLFGLHGTVVMTRGSQPFAAWSREEWEAKIKAWRPQHVLPSLESSGA